MPKLNKMRILVCITPQSNSKRLIDRGHHELQTATDELYILNVQSGSGKSLFNIDGSAELIQSLFEYGSQLGGNVYSVLDDDIPKQIASFAAAKHIDTIVLGAATPQTPGEAYLNQIASLLEADNRSVIILERKEDEHVII